MEGHGEKFTRKMELAIISLLTAPSMAEAAKQAGVGQNTLWRWLKEPAFKEKYQEAKREAVSQAVARLQQLSSTSVDVLNEIANDSEAPASSRVSAAKTIIEMAIKAVELEDIVARVDQLEQLAEARK